MSCEKSERVNSDSNKTDEENLPSVKWPNLCWHLEIKYQTNYLIAAKQAGMPILSTMVLLAHPIWEAISKVFAQACFSQIASPSWWTSLLRSFWVRKDTQSLTDKRVRAKIGQYAQLLGCLDATVAGICLIDPTKTELARLKQAIFRHNEAMARTGNVHHNEGTYSGESCVQPNCGIHSGLGVKAEDFIEQGHQEGVADGHWLKHMKNYAKKQGSPRKTSNLQLIPICWHNK
jgi:hypothetical protein